MPPSRDPPVTRILPAGNPGVPGSGTGVGSSGRPGIAASCPGTAPRRIVGEVLDDAATSEGVGGCRPGQRSPGRCSSHIRGRRLRLASSSPLPPGTAGRRVLPERPVVGSRADDGPGGRAQPAAEEVRGSEGWRISRPAVDGQIEAFTTHASGVPGTAWAQVSTSERATRPRRTGSARTTAAQVRSSGVRVPPRASSGRRVFDPVETRTVVAPGGAASPWTPPRWRPGFYVFRLRTNTGWETQVPYVVSSETPRARWPSSPRHHLAGLQRLGRHSLRRECRHPQLRGGAPTGYNGANDYNATAEIIVRGATGAARRFTNVDVDKAGTLRGRWAA